MDDGAGAASLRGGDDDEDDECFCSLPLPLAPPTTSATPLPPPPLPLGNGSFPSGFFGFRRLRRLYYPSISSSLIVLID